MATQAKTDASHAMLDTGNPTIATAAHNPLGAKLAQEAGFGAVWVHGFELSASYAVRDASILPMSTHLEIKRAMAPRSKVSPSLLTSTRVLAMRSTWLMSFCSTKGPARLPLSWRTRPPQRIAAFEAAGLRSEFRFQNFKAESRPPKQLAMSW